MNSGRECPGVFAGERDARMYNLKLSEARAQAQTATVPDRPDATRISGHISISKLHAPREQVNRRQMLRLIGGGGTRCTRFGMGRKLAVSSTRSMRLSADHSCKERG